MGKKARSFSLESCRSAVLNLQAVWVKNINCYNSTLRHTSPYFSSLVSNRMSLYFINIAVQKVIAKE